MSDFTKEYATLRKLFVTRGWRPFPFQEDVWAAQLAGTSGLLHAPTGMGKTLAVWGGPMAWGAAHASEANVSAGPLALWVTPLRALATDTARALSAACDDAGVPWRVELRTGDQSSHVKQRQEKRPPEALVTTPESLCLLLTRTAAPKFFRRLTWIIVDEWHELMGSKRGVLTELALARLRSLAPGVVTWGLSATLGNLEEARAHLLGIDEEGLARPGRLVRGEVPKTIVLDSLIPPEPSGGAQAGRGRFPWAGHMGLVMLEAVLDELEGAASALVFTNTRNQCELWRQAILEARPEWTELVGVHHGSLDREERAAAEVGLASGALKCVVCTSSLDLGVDFTPVERVIQVGSPKGVARLLQRAGRSGHGPGRVSRATVAPSHAFELVESVAAQDAAAAGEVEPRRPILNALDVLAQHMVTVALGQGFTAQALYAEVRTTAAYASLSPAEWAWALEFVTQGGRSLAAYPQYRRVVDEDGVYVVRDKGIAARHRMSLGAIVSDAAVQVRLVKGPCLGAVEESFVAKLRPGDRFLFAGRVLQLVRVREMTAYVKRATGRPTATPVWKGGRMPLSTELCRAVRRRLDAARRGVFEGPEMTWMQPLFAVQARWSRIPAMGELLIEETTSREGHHLFLYPFEGRLVHEGLAALLSLRLSRFAPRTYTWSANDYGVELLSAEPAPLDEALAQGLFSRATLVEDLEASLNRSELAKAGFREIARVAGLVFAGYPGKNKTTRQVQATSGLLYDVLAKYDPENLLLLQARREVLERQLEQSRLVEALGRMEVATLKRTQPQRVTPLGFPLMVERLRSGTISSEKLADRIARLTTQLERAADVSLEAQDHAEGGTSAARDEGDLPDRGKP